MIVAILASGQSLTKHDVDLVKSAYDKGAINHVIAVSNVGIDLAPWADALVSHDAAWWLHNQRSSDFKGRKFCRSYWRGTDRFIPSLKSGCNSGYMAMCVAEKFYNASKIILLGFDMHGTHYFGRHPDVLRNTSAQKFAIHIRQFDGWNGCEVINCTPNSALKKFPFMPIEKMIDSLNGI